MIPLSLGKVCAACGKERKSKALRYDTTTFNPYCENPYICNEEHPNSVKNLIANQRESKLINHDEAVEAYRKHLSSVYEDSDIVHKIHRMLTSPITVRVQKPEMAQFLIDLQVEKGVESLSEAIRYCVEVMMENKGIFLQDHKVAADNVRSEQAVKDAIAEIEKTPTPVPSKSGDLGIF